MKWLKQIVVALVLAGLALALVFYKRPVWAGLQITHLEFLYHRVNSNYVLTPEGKVHYYEAEPRIPGGGVPLVLVHGLADRSETWEALMPKLRKAGFHVYAPDLLGAGRSPRPADSDYSISTQEQFVTDFIQALGLQHPSVAGNSMGGWVVMKLAIDHPDLVDRVIIYNGAGLRFQIGGGPDVFHPTTGTQLQQLADLLEPGGKAIPSFIRRDALRNLAANQWITDREMTAMQSGKDLLDDSLGKLSRPFLIVWGKNDHLLPFDEALKMHQLVPTSDMDVLIGCGHLAPKTCTTEVADATRMFLTADPAPQGQTMTLYGHGQRSKEPVPSAER